MVGSAKRGAHSVRLGAPRLGSAGASSRSIARRVSAPSAGYPSESKSECTPKIAIDGRAHHRDRRHRARRAHALQGRATAPARRRRGLAHRLIVLLMTGRAPLTRTAVGVTFAAAAERRGRAALTRPAMAPAPSMGRKNGRAAGRAIAPLAGPREDNACITSACAAGGVAGSGEATRAGVPIATAVREAKARA